MSMNANSLPRSHQGQRGHRTPIAILTGFLGSGKTTLLQHVLHFAEMKPTAIIINEFGQVSVDHLLVAKSTENIVELRNGCLCCSIRGDLALTLRDLHHKRLLGEISGFDYVIVETTGLADPVPILHTLMTTPALQSAFRPDVVITCVDAVNGLASLADHACTNSQLAMADVILLTKTDMVSIWPDEALCRAIGQSNPRAEIHEVIDGQIDHRALFRRSLFEPGESFDRIRQWISLSSADLTVSDHGVHYQSYVLASPGPISMAGMAVFLNRIVNEYKGDILRVKGIFGSRERHGRPAVVHGVCEKFYPIQWLDDWPSDDHSSRFVFIGRSFDRVRLGALFNQLCVQ